MAARIGGVLITKMRPRYYCEHCNKGSGSPSAMKRHESGCTLNPERTCRMCALLGNPPPPKRDELLAILDRDGFQALRSAVFGCPACILSALRQRNGMDEYGGYFVAGPNDGRNEWSYAAEKKSWWADYNASMQSEHQ